MPTHFHFLVRITTSDQDPLRRKIGDILSGYTKSINKYHGRTGSLFQQHTKAKLISSDRYLISILNYIHQNPVRAGLTENLEDWIYSSYPEPALNHSICALLKV
jgi:REP element-mobilizing transposase RayT